MGSLTTHVLDTVTGKPASGLRIEVFSMSEDNTKTFVAQQITNDEGRSERPLLSDSQFVSGIFQIEFHVGSYFTKCKYSGGIPTFLTIIPVRFQIASSDEKYHVPILVSPHGYSIYRGS